MCPDVPLCLNNRSKGKLGITFHRFSVDKYAKESWIVRIRGDLGKNFQVSDCISIWLDEKEEQQAKRQTLNDTVSTLTDGRVSPLLSTLNTEWDDISSTQQKYYTRKTREIFAATLSVVSPGQEEALWESLRREPMLENQGTVGCKKTEVF